jgi:prepilin-type N-terminal cleavage/methylation domain-containing protein
MRFMPFRLRSVADKRGFTLTELAIVLGIIGTILGAIWVAASRVYNNQRTDKAVTEVLAIASGIKAMYPNNQIVAAFLMPTAINNGIVPADMIVACPAGAPWGGGASYAGTAGCALNPWNEQVVAASQETLTGSTLAADGINNFDIAMGTMTNAQCASFMPAIVASAATAGLVAVSATGIAPNPMTVTNTTSPTVFAGCSGTVAMQFAM